MRRDYTGGVTKKTGRNRLVDTAEVKVNEQETRRILFPVAIKVTNIDVEDEHYINFEFNWFDNDKDLIQTYYQTLKEEKLNWKKSNPGKVHHGFYNLEKEMFRVLSNLALDSEAFKSFCREKGLYYMKLSNIKFADWKMSKTGGELILEKETIKEALISKINTGWGFFK